MRERYSIAKLFVASCLLSAAFSLMSCDDREPHPAASAPTMRRLTEAQYRNVIADVFGEDIQVSGRFDSPARVDGLLENGTVSAGITPSAFERYEQLARSI